MMDTLMQIVVFLLGLMIISMSTDLLDGASLWLRLPVISLGLLFAGLGLGGLTGLL